jgi:hypothetical protein
MCDGCYLKRIQYITMGLIIQFQVAVIAGRTEKNSLSCITNAVGQGLNSGFIAENDEIDGSSWGSDEHVCVWRYEISNYSFQSGFIFQTKVTFLRS